MASVSTILSGMNTDLHAAGLFGTETLVHTADAGGTTQITRAWVALDAPGPEDVDPDGRRVVIRGRAWFLSAQNPGILPGDQITHSGTDYMVDGPAISEHGRTTLRLASSDPVERSHERTL